MKPSRSPRAARQPRGAWVEESSQVHSNGQQTVQRLAVEAGAKSGGKHG